MDKRIKIFWINFGIMIAYLILLILLVKDSEDEAANFMVFMTLLFVLQTCICFVIGLIMHFKKESYDAKSYFLISALMLVLGFILMMAGGLAIG